MAGDIVAAGFEKGIGRGADAAARSGDQDVHPPRLAAERRRGKIQAAWPPLTNALALALKLAISSLNRPKPCSTWSMSLATFSVSERIAAMVELIESAASAVSSTAAVIIVTVWACSSIAWRMRSAEL